MIFYRYEKPDGGGPYFTKDGFDRVFNHKSNDDTLSGALTIPLLKLWFEGKEEILKDCIIVIYDGELLWKSPRSSECTFKKSTAKRIGETNV